MANNGGNSSSTRSVADELDFCKFSISEEELKRWTEEIVNRFVPTSGKCFIGQAHAEFGSVLKEFLDSDPSNDYTSIELQCTHLGVSDHFVNVDDPDDPFGKEMTKRCRTSPNALKIQSIHLNGCVCEEKTEIKLKRMFPNVKRISDQFCDWLDDGSLDDLYRGNYVRDALKLKYPAKYKSLSY